MIEKAKMFDLSEEELQMIDDNLHMTAEKVLGLQAVHTDMLREYFYKPKKAKTKAEMKHDFDRWKRYACVIDAVIRDIYSDLEQNGFTSEEDDVEEEKKINIQQWSRNGIAKEETEKEK